MTDRPSDTRLWAELADLWSEVDPPPADVTAFARAALGLRTLEADLARLVADTAEQPRSGVRSDVAPRLLTFETTSVTVEVEVLPTGATRRLLGQLVPPGAAHVQVRHPGGAAEAEADHLGRFAVSDVPAGPVSMVCRFPGRDAAPVVTPWSTV